jgi:undecaprenyl-diphosphatase
MIGRAALARLLGGGLLAARQDAALLFAALLAVVGAWAFVEVAEQVSEGGARAFDVRVLRLLRRPDDPAQPVGPAWLVDAARDVTALGSAPVLVLVIVAVLGYLAFARKRREAVLVALAAAGGLLLSTALKVGFARPRPDVVPHLTPTGDPSFPSGHSMLSAVVYLTLGALLAQIETRRRLKVYVVALGLLFACLVGASRVFLGVHYPTDVLAGWSAGLAWALGCWVVARVLQLRGVIAGDPGGDGPGP